MPRYLIVRKFSVTEAEMPRIGKKSKEVGQGDPGHRVGAQPRRRRRQRHGGHVLRLRGAGRGDDHPARAAARRARVLDPGDRRRRHARRLPARRRRRSRRRNAQSSAAAREARRVGKVVQRLEGDRALRADVASARVAFRQELERLAVELDGALLRPAAAGVVGGRDEVRHGAVDVLRLAPVIGERRGRHAGLRRRLLEEAAPTAAWRSRRRARGTARRRPGGSASA